MNKYIKIIITVFIVTVIISVIIPNYIYADSSGIDLGDLELYKKENTQINALTDKAGNIIGMLSAVGVVASVVSLIAFGIKYMLGSVEEKADYKESLKPYVIGAFLVFTVSLIPELIYQFMQNI